MSGVDKIDEAINMVNETKELIQQKYDGVMKKISSLNNQLTSLGSTNHSEQWIANKKQIIESKIHQLTQSLNVWFDDMIKKIQDWFDNIKQEITDFIEQLLKSKITALMGI